MVATKVGSAFALEMEAGGVAVLTFDAPGAPVNTFSRAHLLELEASVDALAGASDVSGLVLRSRKPNNFVAGADLHEILAASGADVQTRRGLVERGHAVFNRVSRLPFPTVAAIDGMCVGGGLECVLAFDYRLVSDNPRTELGAPEVKIGLIPGWGGTQRLPRLVGIDRAIEMICEGRSVPAREAVDIGLAWETVPADHLLEEANRIIRVARSSDEWQHQRQRRERPMGLSPDNLAFNRAVAGSYIQAQTRGHYPASTAAVEAILHGCNLPLEEGLKVEMEKFLPLMDHEISRNLIRLFFMDQRVRKDPGVTTRSISPRPLRRPAILGAGQMGAGITFAHARHGFDVTMNDVSDAAVRAGLERVRRPLEGRLKAGRMSPEEVLDAVMRVRTTTDKADVSQCDLIIEAVIEKRELKCQLFREVEQLVAPDAVIASNTSTISITGMAQVLQHPHRFIGMHFFNPVDRMALVEVIRGRETSDETTAAVVAHAKALGKKPIVVQDCPGFVVNRCLLPYLNEALLLVEEGVEPERVDRAAIVFGMPMGPITLMDLVGLDVTLLAGNVLAEAYADRAVTSSILPRLVEQGRLGQKSGSGFFVYDRRKPGRGRPDGVVSHLVREIGRRPQPSDELTLQKRLFLPMLTEAIRIVEESVVRRPEDVDFAMVHGTGFPAFRGGPLRWCDTLGAAAIIDQLSDYEALGRRFACPNLLGEMARSQGKFFSD